MFKKNNFNLHLEFNIHDIWIGCYWKNVKSDIGYKCKRLGRQEIYVCLIPCIVIHLTTFL